MQNKENYYRFVGEKKDYLLVNKAAGFLVQSSKDKEENNLTDLLSKEKEDKLHLITRLDRPVSGLCLFAKSKRFIRYILEEQEQNRVIKTYLALVEGKLELSSQEMAHYGRHDTGIHKCLVSETPNKGFTEMKSIVNTVNVLDRYTLISIKLFGGKFHQIRAQLSSIGHPVRGDVKYGARRKNKDRSIHLHAYNIQFNNLNDDKVSYTAELPKNDDLWQIVINNNLLTDG